MLKRLFGALLVLSLFAVAAEARPVVPGDTFTVSPGGNRSTSGGPFFLNVTDPNVDDFTSFCVERGEYINFTSTFTVLAVTDHTSTGVALSPFAAYLYNKYHNANFWTRTTAENDLLQLAIWGFMGWVPVDAGNHYVTEAQGSGWTDIGNVRVLQVGKGDDCSRFTYNERVAYECTAAQDQLTIQPVPEPGSLLLFGMGAAALAVARRRWRN